jgi:hypothetical protein
MIKMKIKYLLLFSIICSVAVGAYIAGKTRGFDEAESRNLPYHLGLYTHVYEVLFDGEESSVEELNDLRHDVVMTIYGITNRYDINPDLFKLIKSERERELLTGWLDQAQRYLENEGYLEAEKRTQNVD